MSKKKRPTEALQEREFFFPELNKKVVVMVPTDTSLTDAFNETSGFIQTLIANNKLSDPEAGLNPARPTHAIVKGADNRYRLERKGFN